MFGKNRPNLIVVFWLIWLWVSLSLVVAGILCASNFWEIALSVSWRTALGIVFTLVGVAVGFLSTINFFWAMVAWISENEVKPRSKGAKGGPKIVVIGGGTGLGTILRGLKEITPNLTA
ncbi:MAG TPA: hypothetical protein DDW65_24850, partial [Firmicutes bacterium]|nr:hypothetical protein [Bacillota bacterium]